MTRLCHFGQKPRQTKKPDLTIPVWTAGARRPFATPVWAQTATAAEMPCLTMAKWKTDRVAIAYDVSAVTHPQRPEQKPKHHPSDRNVTMRAWLFGHKIRRQLSQMPHNLAIPNRPFLRRQKSSQRFPAKSCRHVKGKKSHQIIQQALSEYAFFRPLLRHLCQ